MTISRNYQYLDYYIFNSEYIESYDSFRFHSIDNLSLHLIIIKNNKILFNANWKKRISLGYHKILHEMMKQNQLNRKIDFDILINITHLKSKMMSYSLIFLRITQDIFYHESSLLSTIDSLNKSRKKSWFQLHLKNVKQDKGKAIKFRNRRSNRTQVEWRWCWEIYIDVWITFGRLI